jgi:hypothetical protein
MMARGDTARSGAAGGWRQDARENLQRAIERERYADSGDRGETAQKRAAAAEMIVQEANAARLQALLDAAREQATDKTIETAERRFAAARGDWEAAQRPLRASNDAVSSDADADEDAAPDAWSLRRAAALDLRRIGLSGRHTMAGIAVALTAMAAGLFFYAVSGNATKDAVTVARNAPTAPIAPTAPVVPVVTVAPAMEAPETSPVAESADPVPAETASSEKPVPAAAPAKPLPVETVETARAEIEAPPVPEPAVRRALPPRAPTLAPTPGRNPFRAEPAAPVVRAETALHFTVE